MERFGRDLKRIMQQPKSNLISRRTFGRTLALGAGALAFGFPAILKARPRGRRALVLGIDGMDPTLLQRFLAEGRLPHIRKLIDRGIFSPLRTSDPPQSPVAWANFISGTNPGGHGIFDFIARDPITQKPYLSGARLDGTGWNLPIGKYRLPLKSPSPVSLRAGPVLWDELGKHDIASTVLRIPSNYPPTADSARTLSGMGTPDIHGSYGIFTYYTDRVGESTRDVHGGHIERVRIIDHRIDTHIPGPANSLIDKATSADLPLQIRLDPINSTALIRLPDGEFVLREGEWSEWIHLKFPLLPPLAAVHGIARFHLKKARGDFALYLTPVNMDPARSALPISTPPHFAADLAARTGPFYTQGMPEDTRALSSGVFDDALYRQQSLLVLAENLRLFEDSLARFQDGLLFVYLSALDLNSHVFWRTLDRGHPLYSDQLAREHGDFLPWLYEKMDGVVGRALEFADDRTLLLAVSDHGFGSFRRQFNLNGWLMDHGYAAPSAGMDREAGSYFSGIDWSGTRAYGLGINGLYLNVKGRENSGIVPPDEIETVAATLARQLQAIRDPSNGEPVIHRVCRPSEIYSGPCLDRAPDLLVCYAPNYRSSWDTILGGYPREALLDNLDPWSGDHAVDSLYMSGVMLANRPLKVDRPGLEDMAPTLLNWFGLKPAAGMTGRAFTPGS